MDTTATQQAGIMAEAINQLNQCLRAALADEDAPGITRVKDAYETVTSLKLMATRLPLMGAELSQLVDKWSEEGRLCTETALDTDAKVAEFSTAMTAMSTAAQALFIALHDGSRALGPVGWQEPTPAAASGPGTG